MINDFANFKTLKLPEFFVISSHLINLTVQEVIENKKMYLFICQKQVCVFYFNIQNVLWYFHVDLSFCVL